VANCYPTLWKPQDCAYACLELADTGCGIAGKDIENVFDPFFTSKFTGRGLGLAVVMGIVRTHAGAVAVESQLGRGSTFSVFLPLDAEAVPKRPDNTSQAGIFDHKGTVLLVEDEEMVRHMASAILKRLGFTVLEAKDGVQAVEVFRERRDEIRCVVCDLTMPRMDGWETLAALRKIEPHIPVVLASGYSQSQVMSGDRSDWPHVFLGKPYTLKAISEAIARALMQAPRLLLLDEPSMGLAPLLVDAIFEIIQKLNVAGTTILLVEQNARMALQVAHRAYVLASGRLSMEGRASELDNNPEVQKAYLGG